MLNITFVEVSPPRAQCIFEKRLLKLKLLAERKTFSNVGLTFNLGAN